jgi:amino acid adenylation domain-containing protein/non-ribosomal peptide synthase protein (TIGR01720 family)
MADLDKKQFSAEELTALVGDLSDEKRELLDLLLKEQGIDLTSSIILPQKREPQGNGAGYRMPLSFAQRRLWFLDQWEPDSAMYNIATATKITGDLNVPFIKMAINKVVQRHESLRTTFDSVDGQPFQVIAPQLHCEVPFVDLRDRSEEQRPLIVDQLIRDEANNPFDLARGPLIRVNLIQVEDQEYIILITMHHIISDGWSIGIFIQEIVELYQSLYINVPSTLPNLPIQYGDFAVWQQKWLQGDRFSEQLDYWKEQLGSNPPVLNLPTDRPKPAIMSTHGANYSCQLPAKLSSQLSVIGQREGATLFMTLLAAFQTLLYRYSGQEDICVGTPIANRTRVEVERLIGFFVNTLVIRTDLSNEPTFLELLRRVRDVTLESYSHQDLPFEMVVEKLQPDRDLSHSPMFQVLFSLQSASQAIKFPGLSLETLPTYSNTARIELSVLLNDSPDGLSVNVEYNTDLFDESTVERMMGHFRILLEGIVAGPEQRIATLPLLTDAERQTILVDWNATEMDTPMDRCAHELFEDWVQRQPQAEAVRLEESFLTYQELDRRANQLARYLRSFGVGPDVLVGISTERSFEMVIGIMGIMKAGGAYVPIDPTYPAERVSYMKEDSQVSVLLTQKLLLERLGAPAEYSQDREKGLNLDCEKHGPIFICLDEDWPIIGQMDAEKLEESQVSPDNLAYMIYTSGSTGKPKGAMLRHCGLSNLVEATRQFYNISVHSRIMQFAKLSFDVSVWEIFMSLGNGATLILGRQETLASTPDLYRLFKDQGVTTMCLTPSVLRLFSDEEASRQELPMMETVMAGAEVCTPDLIAKWAPGRNFMNGYGPTETTVCVTTYNCEQNETLAPPIGRPIANTKLYILDKNMQPVPVGVPGELFVSGVCLGVGYRNRPELTAEKFVPNPFQGLEAANAQGKVALNYIASDRLYRTGDLVRYRIDGNIEFLGRIDHQVKLHGFRIELGEIEAVLAEHPGIREVVVMAREDNPGEKRLVAYLIPAIEPAPKIAELRDYLKEKLPEYMVPSALVFLSAFPISPSAKVDRKALPAPDMSRMSLEKKYVAPRNAEEEILAEMWEEVLKVPQIGTEDNFFELGGHSLLVTQVTSRVRKVFNVELPVRSLFEANTISKLAEMIRSVKQGDTGKQDRQGTRNLARLSREGELPLSYAQQRLWFLDQFQPGMSTYNIPSLYRFKGKMDREALEGSLNAIIKRHETLRTVIETEGGNPRQIILPELKIAIPVEQMSDLPSEERLDEAIKRAKVEAMGPFNLSQAPLFRLKLYKLAEEDHILLLNIHHIISDGWSTAVMVREMAELYPAIHEGREVSLAELPYQYVDYASWQREWLAGELLQEQLGYWKNQLEGSLPLLELPTDRPRPAVQSQDGDHLYFNIGEDLSRGLERLSRENGTTLFMTILAAFQTMLYRYTNQTDICVGTPIANRSRAELEDLIGFFVNTLVLRSDLSGEPEFRELLERVREVALNAYAHQDIPFEMLVNELHPQRDTSYSPLFQVMFVMQNIPTTALNLPGVVLETMDITTHIAKYDLSLTVAGDEHGLGGVFEYSTDLFDRSTIERMIDHLKKILAEVISDSSQRISRIPILSEGERQHILYGLNDTAVDYPLDTCVHKLFEAQVERTPEGIALVFPGLGRGAGADEVLSYAELEGRANQLGHYLQRLGVGPDVLVGLRAERSVEMVVGLLGTLKAGGAYVPIDPSYPTDRQAYMLADSGVKVVLTQKHLGEVWLGDGADGSHSPVVVNLDADWEAIKHEKKTRPESGVGADNLMYMIYTSGSTGKPKGVLVNHRGVVNRLLWGQSEYQMTAEDRVMQKTPYSFDVSGWEFYWPLITGARLVVSRPEGHKDPRYLMDLVKEQGITVIHFVPPMLQVFLEEVGSSTNQGAESCETLKKVFCSGEALPYGMQERFFEVMRKDVELHNLYGPTEASIEVTYWQCKRGSERHIVPIGYPVANTQMYVLDQWLEPVPQGVAGELHIGGVQIGRGYLNREELTRERFIPDPYGSHKGQWGGARLYKTGDLARYLSDGAIEYLGRLDFQVKIHGFRIELGEIESVLGDHPGIREVVVIVREDNPGEKRLVAYLIPGIEPAPKVTELRNYLKEKLPEYMVPSLFVMMEKLPLTPNGKVDRKALATQPLEETKRAKLGSSYQEPRTAEEKALQEIWKQVLGVEKIGIYDNFFELGGDSILSIQMTSRANQAGLQITPRQIFEGQTIAELAVLAGTGREIQAEQGLVRGAAPLTPIENWFFSLELSKPSYFNQSLLFEVKEALDAKLLEKTVQRLIEHHDALRLRFKRTEKGWQQEHAGVDGEIPFEHIDLAELGDIEQRKAIESKAEASQASLDIEHGPLIRVVYFDLGREKGRRMLIVIHHLAVDGVSWRILIEDFQHTYWQLSDPRRAGKGSAKDALVELPAKTTSFQYWAQKLDEYARNDERMSQLEYWLEVMGEPYDRLAVDKPEGENKEARNQMVRRTMEREETRVLLQDVPGVYKTEINDILLSALVQGYRNWNAERGIWPVMEGETRLLLALEGHGRGELFPEVDLTRTVGWFTNIYPVRLKVKDYDGPGDVIKKVKEQLRRIPQRGMGYGILRYLRQDSGETLSELDEPRMSFNYLGQVDRVLGGAEEDTDGGAGKTGMFGIAPEGSGPPRALSGERPYLIDLNCIVAGGQLGMEWSFSDDVYQVETIELFAEKYLEGLRKLIEHCMSPDAGGYTASDFPLAGMDQAKLDKVLSSVTRSRTAGSDRKTFQSKKSDQ